MPEALVPVTNKDAVIHGYFLIKPFRGLPDTYTTMIVGHDGDFCYMVTGAKALRRLAHEIIDMVGPEDA